MVAEGGGEEDALTGVLVVVVVSACVRACVRAWAGGGLWAQCPVFGVRCSVCVIVDADVCALWWGPAAVGEFTGVRAHAHAQGALLDACVCSVHARKMLGATGGRLLLHELIQYGVLHGIPFLPFASATGLRPLVVMSRVLECCGAAARSALLCSSS